LGTKTPFYIKRSAKSTYNDNKNSDNNRDHVTSLKTGGFSTPGTNLKKQQVEVE